MKPTYRKSWAGNLLMWSDLTLDPFFKVKRGQSNLKVLITRLLFLLFLPSAIRTLGFCLFEEKVFILSLPNLVWVFIGLIACMGLLLVKIAL